MPSTPEEEDMNDRTFAQLKPQGLDELTEEAYQRRRSADLAAAFAAPPAPVARIRRGRPLILAGALAAGVAATAVVVVPGLRDSGTPPQAAPTTLSPTASSTRPAQSRKLDAHTVLLAAAESATRTPADSGRYWYVRDRTVQRLHNVESEYVAKVNALVKEYKQRQEELQDKPDELKAAERKLNREVTKLKSETLPYNAYLSDTWESWRPRESGMKHRTERGREKEISFASPADEEMWRQAGSPELRPKDAGSPEDNDDIERVLSISNPTLNMRNVDELPTERKALESRLRQFYRQQPGVKEDFSVYLWQTSVDLLGAPITPGTREALFRVLAGQRDIVSQGEVTDTAGRAGAALMTKETTPEGERIEYRLIIDPDSAELLQYEVAEADKPASLLRVTLEETGWVDRIGERP
ncbi:hypothetical protein [Nonomuraea glycinis]|uniref:hypothetical protein n=1 Tax=Nonomuraea glycinis TaxID=2047744 RepID=UPI0033B379CF